MSKRKKLLPEFIKYHIEGYTYIETNKLLDVVKQTIQD